MSDLSITRPELSPEPIGTYARVLELGHDPAKVRCCAVPKEGEIMGCPHADKCIFGADEHGGFGPKRRFKGTLGHGPKPVAYYYRDSHTGDAKEDEMPCTQFMVGMVDKLDQQNKTGDLVVILGGPGTPYKALVTLPEKDPVTGLMVSVSRVVDRICGESTREATRDARLEYAQTLRASHRSIAQARRREELGGPLPHESRLAQQRGEPIDEGQDADTDHEPTALDRLLAPQDGDGSAVAAPVTTRRKPKPAAG